jgi:hypothetical protein
MDTVSTSPTSPPSPWWPGYVLAVLFLIGLVVMIVMYIKKPAQGGGVKGTCNSTVCPGPDLACNDDGVCTATSSPSCIPCKNGSGTCNETTGECSSKPCDCSSTCSSMDKSGNPTGLKWVGDDDTGVCTNQGDWSKIECPVECTMTNTCPLGFYTDSSTDTPPSWYDPRRTSGGRYCKSSMPSFPNDAQLKQICEDRPNWKFDDYKCCPNGKC